MNFKKLESKIQAVIQDLKKGKVVIIIDDKNRENEGDLAVAAEKVTGKIINFFIKEARGLVCVAMEKKRLKKLALPQMVKNNQDEKKTKFTISVDAKNVTTGISAYERSETIKLLASDDATKDSFRRPGHIFPLESEKDGLLQRSGHTEAMIELLKLANMKKVGVICEIIRDDGKMARKKDLLAFSKKFDCKIIEIKEIKEYIKTL